jgi:hypothetical protein
MHAGRNAATIVDHDHAAVDLQRNLNRLAEARHMFVDAIINDLIDQMVEAFDTSAADVHRRTLANRIQAFENLDLIGAVTVRLSPLRRVSVRHVFHIFSRHSSPTLINT